MKKIISAVAFATVATSAWAQVPELGDVLGELSTTELDAFNTELDTAVEPMLDIDLDISIDIATVNEAVSQGLITTDEAADLESALSIIEENAGYFDFDFDEFVADALSAGYMTISDVTEVMTIFATLTPEQKTVIGSATFSPYENFITCTSNDIEDCTAQRDTELAAVLTGQPADDFYDTTAVTNSNPLVPVGDITQQDIINTLTANGCFSSTCTLPSQ